MWWLLDQCRPGFGWSFRLLSGCPLISERTLVNKSMFPDDPTMLLMHPMVKVCCQEPSTLYQNITIIHHEESIWHLHQCPSYEPSSLASFIWSMYCHQPRHQCLAASICPLNHDLLITLIGHSTNIKLSSWCFPYTTKSFLFLPSYPSSWVYSFLATFISLLNIVPDVALPCC